MDVFHTEGVLVDMKVKIFDFFKSLFFNSELSFLKEKDIIIARRYNNEQEKMRIEEGHRVSPFIVIYKSWRKVYALECSSNKSSKSIQLFKVDFKNKPSYNLTKDGYIYVGKIHLLNKNRFIKKVGTLDDADLNRIYKSIFLVKRKYKIIDSIPDKKLKFYFDTGDVILYGGRVHYIGMVDEEYYYLYEVQGVCKGGLIFKINDKSYSFNFKNCKKVSRECNFRLLNIASIDMVNNIKQIIINEQKKIDTASIASRGKLVLFNEGYFFIYGEYKDCFLTYRVYLDKDKKNGMHKIPIEKKTHYTYFEEVNLKKSNDIKVIKIASDSEISLIKNGHKNVKRSMNNECASSIVYKNYAVGCIMVDYKTLDRYIILERNQNTIIYALISDLEKIYTFTFTSYCKIGFEVVEKMEKYRFLNVLREYKVNKNV